MTNYEQIAEKMYAAYCQQAGGLTFDGKPLPSFSGIGLERQSCWRAAAEAAHEQYAKHTISIELQQHPDTTRLQQAVWRLEDLLKDDDPQAWKEARKFLERLKKEQEMEAQPQADALDAERYRWLRDQGSLAEGSRHPQSWRCVAMLADMGGEHADTAIDAAIAAAKENK